MVSKKRIIAAAIVSAIALGAGGAAVAHGKVGLWSITLTMKSTAIPQGMHVTGQHCMTAAEVAVNDFSAAQRKDKTCKIVSQKITGGSMEADLVCSGDLNGKGHMKFVFDSDTHYTGKMSMTGVHNGKVLSSEETFDGHWVKVDCAGVKS